MSKYNIHPDFRMLKLVPRVRKFQIPVFNFLNKATFNSGKTSENVEITNTNIKGYQGVSIPVMVVRPKNIGPSAPCLLYCHGGGFFFEAISPHRKAVIDYAIGAGCVIVFPHYRVSWGNSFPTSLEDCYETLVWTGKQAKELGINPDNIAIAGESAGGCLAACVAQMAQDRKSVKINFQMLVYPVADHTMSSQSMKDFYDTPLWNTPNSKLMWDVYLKGVNIKETEYLSPLQRKNLTGLPPAYIETAEFDCLRDEDLLYAERLKEAGVAVELNQTKGTVHAYEIAFDSSITKEGMRRRIEYMRKGFDAGR